MKNLSVRLPVVLAATLVLFYNTLQTHAAAYTWNVASPAANNWNVGGNWDVANFPGFGGSLTDVATFGATGTSGSVTTINNVVSVNTTIATLNFTNTTAASWHVTQIPSSTTLTVSGVTTVGFGTAVNSLVTSAAMNGGGTLALTGALTIGNNGSSSADTGTILDLSGLTNFSFNASGANITLSTGNRSGADLKLAAGSNYITAANLNANSASTSSGASGTLTLGAGTNNINVGAISMAQARNNSTMTFPATGGLRLRGTGGTDADRASLILANRNQATSGGNNTGTINFNGHPVDVKFSTVTMGQAQNATPTGAQSGIGIINFDAGTIDATTILMAISSANAFNSGIATITVGTNSTLGASGTLIVGTGGISLANQGALGTSTGNLNISGGTVISSGAISKATVAGIGNLNITNGTLVASNTIGTLAIPLTALNVSNATMTITASSSVTNVVVGTLNAVAGANNTINIGGSLVVGGYPAQISLIKYISPPSGDLNSFVLGTLPAGSPAFQGYISNNTTAGSIDLVVTGGPTPPPATKSVTWDGEVSGNWDTTTTNWITAGNLTNYNNVTVSAIGDNVTFDDTLLGTTTVNLTQVLSPSSLVVNSAANYSFTGSGKITGSIGLTKQGSGTVTFANSTPNDFSGAITITAGTVAYDQATDFSLANAVSGAGSLAKNNNNTVTLPNANSFTGGLVVNGGAVRANAINAPGTGLITVSGGGAFVAGAAHTNSITLSNGTLGTSLSGGFTMSTNKELIIAANTTNKIYSADPQSPATSFQLLVDANLRGSGTVIAVNAPVNNPDGGQGVRFRNTNAVSDFSGTVVFTNNVKGELLLLTTPNGSFSPIGSGKIVLCAGSYLGTNGTLAATSGGYSELNLRNNGVGSVTVGNDLAITGSGAAVINGLTGSNGVTMGNLKIGAGQELIGYKAAGTPTNTAIFTSVILAGTATFSPHSTNFGAANQAGTDLSLGPITETVSGSGIIMLGAGNLTLTGVNGYTGDTVINNGVVLMTNSASISTSPNIVMGGGATLNVSGLSSTFALGASQTLSNKSSTAVLSGSANSSSGTLSLTYTSPTPSFNVANGTLTLSPSTTVKVANNGPALTKGSYKIVSVSGAGTIAGTVPTTVTVGGNGLAGPVTPSLQITGNELFVVVPNSAPVIANIVTNSTSAGLTWKIAISNLSTAAGWSDPDGDSKTLSSVGPTSNLGASITSDSDFVYYNSPVTNEDYFTYTITDGSLTANGTVYLEPVGAPPAPATANQIVRDGNNVPTITFAGIPGRTNVTEASTNLINWGPISTNVAATNGLWQVIDTDATNYLNRFYRSYQPYP